MKDEHKELSKSSGTATVDTLAAAIDASIGGVPLATGAWAFAKAIIGNGLALRQTKALEWVEMIQQNPEIFTQEVFESEYFQDAFVTSLETYIKERDDYKRILLRNIFLDFNSVKNPKIYPLERMYEITRQITLYDAKNLSYWKMIMGESKPSESIATDLGKIESTNHLISLGLLIRDDSPRFAREGEGLTPPRVVLSSLGSQYIGYIKSSSISNIDSTN